MDQVEPFVPGTIEIDDIYVDDDDNDDDDNDENNTEDDNTRGSVDADIEGDTSQISPATHLNDISIKQKKTAVAVSQMKDKLNAMGILGDENNSDVAKAKQETDDEDVEDDDNEDDDSNEEISEQVSFVLEYFLATQVFMWNSWNFA